MSFIESEDVMRTDNRKQLRSAFTLIELLLVMVILAVLAAVVVPRFAGKSKDAKIKAAITGVASLKTALDTFEVENGRYPSSDEGIGALVNQPSGMDKWGGPYIDTQNVTDPWERPWQYRYPGTYNQRGYDVFSLGEDGVESADDIGNWAAQQQ
jgi:general secretion pathway protein G